MADVIKTGTDATLSGTANGDLLYGTGGGNGYFGGAGNDGFVISLASLQKSGGTSYNDTIKADAAILDFGGAGGWAATNNDFLSLTGFSAGSTLTFNHYGSVGTNAQFYTVHDAASNTDYTIYVNSTDGKQLKLGDYNFY